MMPKSHGRRDLAGDCDMPAEMGIWHQAQATLVPFGDFLHVEIRGVGAGGKVADWEISGRTEEKLGRQSSERLGGREEIADRLARAKAPRQQVREIRQHRNGATIRSRRRGGSAQDGWDALNQTNFEISNGGWGESRKAGK